MMSHEFSTSNNCKKYQLFSAIFTMIFTMMMLLLLLLLLLMLIYYWYHYGCYFGTRIFIIDIKMITILNVMFLLMCS